MMALTPLDLKDYVPVIREDKSLMFVPFDMYPRFARKNIKREDFSMSADKGYIVSTSARRKIRAAANSLYLTLEREKQLKLKFVTFTFPKIPVDYLEQLKKRFELRRTKAQIKAGCPPIYKTRWAEIEQMTPKQQEDIFLHELFKLFLDNERKNHGLKRWLWVNDRQDGKRLKEGKKPRNVLHYHCLFDYDNIINYQLCNLRFLNLLRRYGFTIYNQIFLAERFDKQRAQVEAELDRCNYHFFKYNFDRLKVHNVFKGAKQSIFLNPVDFSHKPIENIIQLSRYLSPYMSELKKEEQSAIDKENPEEKKVFARRWGASRGLIIQREQMQNLLVENGFKESDWVDQSTGELFPILSKDKLLQFWDLTQEFAEIRMELNSRTYTLFYFKPQWELWRQVPETREFFKRVFNYNIY